MIALTIAGLGYLILTVGMAGALVTIAEARQIDKHK